MASPPSYLPEHIPPHVPPVRPPHAHPRQAHKFTDNVELAAGADLWEYNRAAAFAKYGPMSDWDVSDITSMSRLFGGFPGLRRPRRPHFNEDLSRWNVSRVTDMAGAFHGAKAFTGAGIGCWDVSRVTCMYGMLNGATSFNQRLGGQWATSTADKRCMFNNGCPGSIEGKTNDADGTPV